MRKLLILLSVVVPVAALGGVAALTLPALAESDDGSCAALPAADAGPIDLSVIPANPVTGSLSVRGVGDDDDCGLSAGEDDNEHSLRHAGDDHEEGDD